MACLDVANSKADSSNSLMFNLIISLEITGEMKPLRGAFSIKGQESYLCIIIGSRFNAWVNAR